jgi:hypothetical protein
MLDESTYGYNTGGTKPEDSELVAYWLFCFVDLVKINVCVVSFFWKYKTIPGSNGFPGAFRNRRYPTERAKVAAGEHII